MGVFPVSYTVIISVEWSGLQWCECAQDMCVLDSETKGEQERQKQRLSEIMLNIWLMQILVDLFDLGYLRIKYWLSDLYAVKVIRQFTLDQNSYYNGTEWISVTVAVISWAVTFVKLSPSCRAVTLTLWHFVDWLIAPSRSVYPQAPSSCAQPILI